MASKKSAAKTEETAAAKVRAYLASLPPDARRELKKIRDVIRAAAPDATESISYGIPTFKLDGRVLIYCAGWKNHTSVYPLTPAIMRVHGAELEKYETSKGTVRFPLSKPVPIAFVKRLVKTRMAEMRTGK